jgi:Xaa-Pro dipeptidase
MASNQPIYQVRQEKLRQVLVDGGFNGMVINPSPSLHYLTGMHYHLSERPVVLVFPVVGEPAIILPQLEILKTKDLSYPLQIFPYGEDPSQWIQAFKAAVQATNLLKGSVGVESRALRFLELNLLQGAAPAVDFQIADSAIASLRVFKDSAEIQAMQEAVLIAEEALKMIMPKIKIGVTEQAIATELTIQLMQQGSNPRLPFFPIVSTGPNSANPHAGPSKRPIAEGDLLVIDYGANVNGYLSDITRTFAIGTIDPEFQQIAEVVLKANQAAHQITKPGVRASTVDQAARQVIESAGYGEYFIHRTGHGLGLEGHEEPYIRSDNPERLAPGMCFTIEPGIYLPGRGGVRIEDDVVITAEGCQSLTNLPRELIVLG